MMTICVTPRESSGSEEEVVLHNYVRFAEGELPVEDIDEFPFYTADIALSEQSGPSCPIDILRRCLIDVLKGHRSMYQQIGATPYGKINTDL